MFKLRSKNEEKKSGVIRISIRVVSSAVDSNASEAVIIVTMSATVTSCYLRSVRKAAPNIYLPDSTPIFVGRSPETGITDTKCSRQQGCLATRFFPCVDVLFTTRKREVLHLNHMTRGPQPLFTRKPNVLTD